MKTNGSLRLDDEKKFNICRSIFDSSFLVKEDDNKLPSMFLNYSKPHFHMKSTGAILSLIRIPYWNNCSYDRLQRIRCFTTLNYWRARALQATIMRYRCAHIFLVILDWNGSTKKSVRFTKVHIS
jgi:hypothetical protein